MEDATAQILPLGPAARGRLAVRYRNAAGLEEAGIDAGGLFKELLADVCASGLDPNRGVFTCASSADNYVYPAAAAGDSPEGLVLLELVGKGSCHELPCIGVCLHICEQCMAW